MLSSMPVIRSAAEDARLPELGWREGREKGNHPVAQDGVEGGCTAQHTHWCWMCALTVLYTLCLKTCINIKASLCWSASLACTLGQAWVLLRWMQMKPLLLHVWHSSLNPLGQWYSSTTPLTPPLHTSSNNNTASEIWIADQTSLHWMKNRFHQTVTASDNLTKTVKSPSAQGKNDLNGCS